MILIILLRSVSNVLYFLFGISFAINVILGVFISYLLKHRINEEDIKNYILNNFMECDNL